MLSSCEPKEWIEGDANKVTLEPAVSSINRWTTIRSDKPELFNINGQNFDLVSLKAFIKKQQEQEALTDTGYMFVFTYKSDPLHSKQFLDEISKLNVRVASVVNTKIEPVNE